MRIGVLEYALNLSPYNFDIQLALVRIYDSHGLSLQFRDALQNMGIKGVQQESMGFFQLRHSLEWGQLEALFKPSYARYQKYAQYNERDLNQLKHKSFQADNWDQIENFIEYEQFLKQSYFERLCLLMNRVNDQMKGTNSDATKDSFDGTRDQVKSALQQCNQGLTRTQDLKILLPKFSIADKGQILDSSRPHGHDENTFLDKLNRILIKDDPHYSKYKFERQSNFKTSLINTLGVLENQAVYKKILSMLSLVSTMYQGVPLTTQEGSQEEEKKEESKEASPVSQLALDQVLFSSDELETYDYADVDAQQIAGKLASLNAMISSVYKVYSALCEVVKTDGQPATEVASQILTKVQPVITQMYDLIEAQNAARGSIESLNAASSIGLKWFFIEMTLYSSVIVPALDALSLKLKSTVPSFKKKKGALPAEVDQVQKSVWNTTKTALKTISESIEQQSAQIEAALN